MTFGIKHIEYYFPEKVLTNKDFSYLGIDANFMEEKIGIEKRYIAAENESTCDMAEKACIKLFNKRNILPSEIKILVLCTQNPDYLLPTTACILQDKLGLPKDSICFDINLGCSGFVYGLALVNSLMHHLNHPKALLVTSEAYSKVINYNDKTVATLFSDGAAACVVEAGYANCEIIDFDFGTDGRGFENLIVPVSGSREKRTEETKRVIDYGAGISRSRENLYMNGQEITKFVFKEIPASVNKLLERNNINLDMVNKFIFHQANKYMLESLAKRMNIPQGKNYINLSIGNTVSSTIPIALKMHYSEDNHDGDSLIILSGFGVGYSWATSLIKINNKFGELL